MLERVSLPPPGPIQPPGRPGRRAASGTSPLARAVTVGAGLLLALMLSVGAVAVYRMSRSAGPSAAAGGASSTEPLPSASVLPTRRGAPSVTLVPSASDTPSPTPSSSASTGPGPQPSTTPPKPLPDRSLTRNTLYGIDLGKRRVSCRVSVRRPKPPLKNSQLAPYLRTVTGCLNKVFDAPLTTVGFTTSTPKVTAYGKTVKTPCGTYSQSGSPAYYCSGTRTLYWPNTVDGGDEAYTFARLGYVGLAAHEFGHHLQYESGLIRNYGVLYYGSRTAGARYLLSRRLELQAQCFEGVFLHQVSRSLRLSAADRSELRTWHSYTGDEDPPSSRKPDHGTSSAQVRWLFRGLDSGDFGRCNTWSASKASVR